MVRGLNPASSFGWWSEIGWLCVDVGWGMGPGGGEAIIERDHENRIFAGLWAVVVNGSIPTTF